MIAAAGPVPTFSTAELSAIELTRCYFTVYGHPEGSRNSADRHPHADNAPSKFTDLGAF